jgi:UDP-arabinose 4-epimerase
MPDAILVTGGAGYVGSQVSKALRRQGFLPVAYDNLSRGNRWAVKWGPLEEGDLADQQRLAAVMQKYRPAAIMHFAAYCYVAESVADPLLYYRNNVVGSVGLFEAAGRCGIRKLVFSSTCATYGDPLAPQIAETHPQIPTSPYGASKLMVERILHDLHHADGLDWVSLRYFNAAGADPEGELGEAHEPETRLIPLTIRAAIAPEQPLTVFGTDYSTPDGTAIRDYIHVADLAEAHVLALKRLLAGGGNLAANLGTGRGHSVLDVVAAVERVSDRKVALRRAQRRPGDPPCMVADASLARRELGWRAEYPELDRIVETAWRWHSQRPGAFAR